jgi:hypothetical protein
MLIGLLVIFILLILTISITEFILIRVLLKKQAVYQTWVITTRSEVKLALKTMREIDKQGVFSSREVETGIFESDDLVGQTFKQLTDIVEDLNKKIE